MVGWCCLQWCATACAEKLAHILQRWPLTSEQRRDEQQRAQPVEGAAAGGGQEGRRAWKRCKRDIGRKQARRLAQLCLPPTGPVPAQRQQHQEGLGGQAQHEDGGQRAAAQEEQAGEASGAHRWRCRRRRQLRLAWQWRVRLPMVFHKCRGDGAGCQECPGPRPGLGEDGEAGRVGCRHCR